MDPAILPKALQAKCYCPSCGGALARSPTADTLAICLSCPADHRFFVLPESARAGDTAKAATLHFSDLEHQTPAQVMGFWLSNPVARQMLNEQLAELLRTIADDRVAKEHLPACYCPICGCGLAEYDQPDIWVTGLRCSQGHAWATRGGRLGCVLGGVTFGLHAELSQAVFRQLVSGWLKGNPVLNSNLHPSVRRLLAGASVGDGAAQGWPRPQTPRGSDGIV